MGFIEGIKGFYSTLEEEYYNVLDEVNEHIPIYGIIDPIDKIVPSFAFFGILGLIFLTLIAFAITGSVFPNESNSLAISVEGTNLSAIENANVTFKQNGELLSTTETDEFGVAKQLNLKLDDEIEIIVEKEEYLTFSKTVIIFELPQGEEVTLQKESEAYSFKTIRLLDDLGQPIRGNFTLKFRCSNPYAAGIPEVTLTPSDNGTTTVKVQNDCERLSVDVIDTVTFSEIIGEVVISDDFAIYLSDVSTEDGTLIINVEDLQGSPLDGIKVELYKYSEILDNPNVGPITVAFTYSGQANFSIYPGDYLAKTYDEAGNYGEATSERLSVTSEGIQTTTISLREDVKGQIKIKVTNKKNGETIEDAKVKLYYSDSDAEITSIETDESGEAKFNISRDVEYKAIITAESYQIGRASSLTIGESFNNVKLSKCTPTTCGSLKVKVVDQDNTAMRNATVALYNASTNFVAGYDTKITDLNGVAEFFGVSSGNYYAFAFKEGFSGRSDASYFSSSASENNEANLEVTMEVGEGIVRVNVLNEKNQPMAFASIGLFNARTNEKIGNDFTNAEGVKEFTLKADTKVYIIVSKPDDPDYAKFISIKKPILSSEVQVFDVKLEKKILKNNVELVFLGMFKENQRVQNAKAGETYNAKFVLKIPEEKEYEEVGVHIRTGQDVLMEKDKILIEQVNAPRTSQVRATRYEEKSELEEEDYDFTVGDAKWINLEWRDPEKVMSGTFEIEAEITIKESAALGDKMFLYYRAWGEEDNDRDRFPEDDSVSIELYSNTKKEIIQAGIVTLCDEDFCFTATITDLKEDLIDSVTETYNAKIFNQYTVNFIITNNSETKIHNNANLRINNADESLKFFNYSIINSESKETEGVVNGYEFERLPVGNLQPKNSIRITADFTPQKAVNGILEIKLVSDQSIVFNKALTIIVGAPKELDLEVDPSFYLSGVQNDISVLVTDKSNLLEIEKAIVKLKDKHGNILDYDVSGKDGLVNLTLPAQAPGTKLKIEAEKENYNVKVVEVEVSEDLLEITPASIGVSLNTKNKLKSEETIALRNIVPYSLKIKSIALQGNFKNLIDKQQVKNWLESSYTGMVIDSEEKAEIILKTFLTEEAKTLNNRIDLEGELVIIMENFGNEWLFKTPVKIAIGLGDEVDDPTCLVVTRSEWITSTSGTPKRTEFQIQNNCTVGGNPVALQDLEAKINWNTNQLGEFTLTFGADEIILRHGYYRLMLGTIKAEQTLTAILTFTPFGGVNGLADADIIIQATNPLDQENQVMQNTMNAKITSVNIAQCISYDKETLVLNQEEIGTITVTADESCGEPVNFDLESDLSTSPANNFTLQPGQSQTIEIFSEQNYPGQYPVLLSPKFSSNRKEQLLKNLRVIINAQGCWQLSKYEFDIYDDVENEFDGFDVANLSNTCVEKPVQVRVEVKDFQDALEDGMFWGLASMATVMLSNWSNPETTLMGHDKAAKEAEKAKTQAERDALELEKKAEEEKTRQELEANKIPTTVGNYSESITKTKDIGGITYGITESGTVYILNTSSNQWEPTTENPFAVPEVPEITTEPSPEPAPRPPAELTTQEPPVTPQSPEGLTVPGKVSSPISEIIGLPPIQGFAIAAGSYGGGMTGGLLGGASGLVQGVLGTNPLTAGILGTMAGTTQAYTQQEKEITFTVLQKDTEITDIVLVQGTKEAEQIDESIGVSAEGITTGTSNASSVNPQPLQENADLISQGIENFRTMFTNLTGFVTTQAQPKYSNLVITGERHKYKDKTYEKEDFINEEDGFLGAFDDDVLDKEKTELEEEDSEQLEQRFHLEFNSIPPEIDTVEPTELLNCQSGTRIGSTGYDALPKVKFAWTWNDIAEDECNEDNENGIYCDGTQFSIALLKKINAINEFVTSNGSSFSCPSPREDEEATNEIDSYDIGIGSVSVAKKGVETQVLAEIENTNPGIITTGVTIKAIGLAGQGEVNCADGTQEITVPAGGKEIITCDFGDLSDGFYKAEVEINPSISCENCEDILATNKLSRTFFAGTSGLEQCEPYSTSRLDLFLQATGITNDELVAMTKFNARLMVDGYSTDFQEDFDLAQAQAFFSTPDFYANNTEGLGIYFKDSDLFSFDSYSQPDYSLPGPGLYNVIIDIEYEDNSWSLFDSAGNPKAKITIKLEKLKGPEPDSPFYYMPFDGLVGEDTGRVGYGINYQGDSTIIDNSTEPIRTVEISGSSPIPNGILTVTKSESFKKMQVDEKGLVAKVSREGEGLSLLMQPSNATPVILQIDKTSTGDAYATYQIGVDGDAIDVGPTLSLWNGIGASCRAFDDSVMSQQQFVPDTHGISTRCALVGENERSKYALEFCENPINFGSVFYKTVFYTPQNSDSYLQLTDVSSDSAILIGSRVEGKKVQLNGTTNTKNISTLEDVFDLVKSDYLCISKTSLNAEFFWNPKKVMDSIQSKEEDAINSCISS